MRRDRGPALVAHSDELALAVDEFQYGRGQGPCLDTLRTGDVVSVADLAEEVRWSEYRVHALACGVRSSLSLPLLVNQQTLGALNLYTTTPQAFGRDETRYAEAFARQVASALTVVLRSADQLVLEHQLRNALATRPMVDQAVGIMMGQKGIAADDAFALLQEASQIGNRKLRDVAADLIHAVTGKPPTVPRPFSAPR